MLQYARLVRAPRVVNAARNRLYHDYIRYATPGAPAAPPPRPVCTPALTLIPPPPRRHTPNSAHDFEEHPRGRLLPG